ncbi:hypothetical protein BMS3Abin11_01514 [bacterium BMS3Abin11]|nr:hypothetical protein BMS3Abin11_01514 [bacterium BMS3Abin11]GMT41582.1 MAG: hypothetical protein IEMM0001_2317 [bacterium]
MHSRKITIQCQLLMLMVIGFGLSTHTAAQAASDAGLAQELTNPIANLVTIPIQMNYDNNIGLNDKGSKIITNIQPVIPVDVNEDWTLITRTIVPIISQDKIFPDGSSQFGLGDINEQLFFSPKKPTSGGITWGVGAALLLPTATDSKLGSKKLGAGPSVVAITMRGPWTFGAIANHVWSFAGDKDRIDISNTFMQPFMAYTWPNTWTVSAQTETTYNWKLEEWAIPVNVAAAKLVKFGKVPVSLQAGVGYWLESPTAGPEGVRFRLQANIVLPR